MIKRFFFFSLFLLCVCASRIKLTNLACAADEHLKRLISDPFDFHHLTHTSPAQFRSLDKTREVDLVTEFSAIRASQKPEAGLKGIRAEDIHFRDFSSSEDLTNYEPVTTQERPSSVESVSPTSHASRARSESRVFENFSRPMPRYPRADSTTPPSATSSKLASSPDMSEPAPRAIDEILGLHSPQTYPEHVYSTAEEAEKISASMAQITLEGIFQLNGGVHARAGSSANTLTSDLEDVPEEEEEVNCWRDSPELSPRLPACRSSSSLNQLSARALSSIPNPKSRFPACIADELSTKFSNALGSPTLPQYRLFQEGTLEDQTEEAAKESPIAKTVVYEDISESWDDDIDFCYEHAAESNCNFDWFSTNEPVKQLTSETLYGQNLAADNESKGHFPLGTHAVIRPADLPVSPQSNLSQLSRYNSEESLILSRAASIVRKHRSSVSTNSVPELVHSSTSSREGTVAESSAHETSVSPRSPSIPVPVRPGSSSRHHRQTKSLAPEIERHARSMAPRTHDRARSASEGATQIRSRAIKTDGSQLPTVKQSSASKGAGRKKGRVSYSLFPSPEGVAV